MHSVRQCRAPVGQKIKNAPAAQRRGAWIAAVCNASAWTCASPPARSCSWRPSPHGLSFFPRQLPPLPAHSRRAPHRRPAPDHSHSNTSAPHSPTQPCGVAASTEGFGPADPGSSPGRAIQPGNRPAPTWRSAQGRPVMRPSLGPCRDGAGGRSPARSRRDSQQGRPFAAWDHGGMRGGHGGANRGRRRLVHT